METMNDKNSSIQIRLAQKAEATQSDLAGELARADSTLATLRLEVISAVTKYRLWRAHMRCGRAVDASVELFNMPMVKKIRGLWATYRFAQMVRADICHMMALETETRAKLDELNEMAIGSKPELISYDELESRFGPATAQELYDDMLAQLARDVAKRKLVS